MILQLPNNHTIYTENGPTTVGKLTGDQKVWDRLGNLVEIKSITDPQSVDVYKITCDNGRTDIVGGDHQLDVFINNQAAMIYTASELANDFIDNAFIDSQRPCSYAVTQDEQYDPKTAGTHARVLAKGLTDPKEIDEINRPLAARQYFVSGLMGNKNYYYEDKLHFDLTQNNVRDTIATIIESIGLIPVIEQTDKQSTITISWQPRMLVTSIQKVSRKQKCRTIELADPVF